ncbi:MAG: NAD(P)-binding domain-containing protein [Actinomycetota bacterium]|nr:NAD(P)-binding domain-containing protein [Actinomycetota bacterium]
MRAGQGLDLRVDALAFGVQLAEEVGAGYGASAEVVVLAVPWAVVDEVLDQAGGSPALVGRLVVDTTNQFGRLDGRLTVVDLGGDSGS